MQKKIFSLRLLALGVLALSLASGAWAAHFLSQSFESALLLRFLVAFVVAYVVLLLLMLVAARGLAMNLNRLSGLRAATVSATAKRVGSGDDVNLPSGVAPETADTDFFVSSFFIICRTLFWFWSDGPRLLVGLPPQNDHNLVVTESNSTRDIFYMIFGSTLVPAVMLLGIGGVLIVILRL